LWVAYQNEPTMAHRCRFSLSKFPHATPQQVLFLRAACNTYCPCSTSSPNPRGKDLSTQRHRLPPPHTASQPCKIQPYTFHQISTGPVKYYQRSPHHSYLLLLLCQLQLPSYNPTIPGPSFSNFSNNFCFLLANKPS
jgi:hypothetical protein